MPRFTIIVAAAALCSLGACSSPQPHGVSSMTPAAAPSGVTSSNGGGTRQLNNNLSVGVAPNGSSVTTAPNTKGNGL